MFGIHMTWDLCECVCVCVKRTCLAKQNSNLIHKVSQVDRIMACVRIPHDLGVVCNCVRLNRPSSRKQFSVNQGDLGFARILLAMPSKEIKMVTFWGIRMTWDLCDFVCSCFMEDGY